ncbi:hypothetical protein GQ457_15G009320 [Hibiscus cannabinus]
MLNPNPRIIYPKTILTSPRSRKIIHAKLPSSSRMPSSGYVSLLIFVYENSTVIFIFIFIFHRFIFENLHVSDSLQGLVVPKILLAWLGQHRRDRCVVLLHVTMHGLAAGNNVRRGEPLVSIDVVIVASGDAYESDS